jgi:hypothetical protein
MLSSLCQEAEDTAILGFVHRIGLDRCKAKSCIFAQGLPEVTRVGNHSHKGGGEDHHMVLLKLMLYTLLPSPRTMVDQQPLRSSLQMANPHPLYLETVVCV